MAFPPDEIAAIERLMAGRERLACPRCGHQLHSGTPVAGGGSIAAIWEVHCEHCNRTAVIGDRRGEG